MDSHVEKKKRYEDCVRQFADSIYRVAFRLMGNETQASELVQETYLAAWESLEKLREPQRMKSWMFAILRNQRTKLLSRESRAEKTLGESVVDLAETKETDTRVPVQQGIEQLDEDQRLPILLVVMEGMSVDEAALALEIPRGTVLSRLHRGRKKLKEILSREMVDRK